MSEAINKLAEAMGWELVEHCGTKRWIRPGTIGFVGYLELPFHPLTDANDDVDVLEWARKNLNDKEYAQAMLEVVQEQGADIYSSFPVYVKGNYARAACKNLNIELDGD